MVVGAIDDANTMKGFVHSTDVDAARLVVAKQPTLETKLTSLVKLRGACLREKPRHGQLEI